GWYQATFTSIAVFIREAIVNPILRELPDAKSVLKAAQLMRAITIVIQSIPVVLTNLARAMSMMSNPDSLRDAPGEKIMEQKEEFRVFFKSVAIFMREAIVNPI